MLDEINRLKRIAPLSDARLTDSEAKPDNCTFFLIRKLSVSDELDLKETHKWVNQCIKQFVISMSGSSSPLVFRVASSTADRALSVYIGSGGRSGPAVAERFGCYFQAADMEEAGGQSHFAAYREHSLITGIPALSETDSYTYLEPFIRMLLGKDAMLEVAARPVHKGYVLQQLHSVTAQRTANAKLLNISRSESKATSETYSSSSGETMTDGSNSGGNLFVVNSGSTLSEGVTSSSSDSKGLTETVTINTEHSDYQAFELDGLLETHTERLRHAQSSGLWRTAVSICAQSRSELAELAHVYRSAYSGEAVEPYQIFDLPAACSPVGWLERDALQGRDMFHDGNRAYSFLTSEELACLFDVPKADYNGYEFVRAPRFAQNTLDAAGIPLGRIYDGDNLTSTVFSLDRDQLVKHLLVAGITGSGKTNTIFNLLRHVGVSFLIIEPAKKEYRGMIRTMPDLRVYTLGSEGVSPLRINPFYFPQSVNIQQHIDNLKVIFNASFTMYASMPNILEQCISNVYMKKGWSLTTSANIYQSDDGLYHKYFPTIEDLYHEVDSYTKELGYAQEQTQNIRAALLTRIKSLMTGGKGWMLNTVETMDVGELLRYPTILELEAVADDDEKSLMIGLISIFIYEYLKSQESFFTGELKHVLVFEEAHRIFANVNQHGSQETVNIKGKAVESLSHILSEIRAYGEGMIIVDQVPTKLAPDVLKNTNTKIIHRIVSKDDSEYVANSLGLTEEKANFISRLRNGSALSFTDGMSGPVHLQIYHGKQAAGHVTDREMKVYSRAYNPLVHHAKPIHPLTEIILQHLSVYDELRKEADAFYRKLLGEQLQHLHRNYAAAKQNILRHAAEYGFDMNINVDDFAASLIRELLLRFVKTNEKIRKQINKQIFLERFIEAGLELLPKPYDIHKKEYMLLELNRKKLGGEYTG